jgi:hypothetical protein
MLPDEDGTHRTEHRVFAPIQRRKCSFFYSKMNRWDVGSMRKYSFKPIGKCPMSRPSVWATKVAALIKGNNTQAAIAQIKVAPTVKDLQQLRALLTADGSLLKHRMVDEATRDQIVALSAPRLHRSP